MLTSLLIALIITLMAVVVIQHRKIVMHKCRATIAIEARTTEVREQMIASIEEATALADKVAEQIAVPPTCASCSQGWFNRLVGRFYSVRK